MLKEIRSKRRADLSSGNKANRKRQLHDERGELASRPRDLIVSCGQKWLALFFRRAGPAAVQVARRSIGGVWKKWLALFAGGGCYVTRNSFVTWSAMLAPCGRLRDRWIG